MRKPKQFHTSDLKLARSAAALFTQKPRGLEPSHVHDIIETLLFYTPPLDEERGRTEGRLVRAQAAEPERSKVRATLGTDADVLGADPAP